MKVLLTGASGFIGQHLVRRLTGEHDIWRVGRPHSAPAPAGNFVPWDMSSRLDPAQLPAQIDAVIHLAQSRDYRAFPDQAPAIVRVNVQATLELLDYARRARAKRFVFASSGGVYAGSPLPISESAAVEPPDFYLSTKAAGEMLARSYEEFFDVTTLRLFFVYGLGQATDRFMPRLVRRVLAGEPVTLYGQEGLRLNPVHVSDAAEAIGASLDLDGSHLVNVAGPDVLTLKQLACLIGQAVRREPTFELRRSGGTGDLVADITEMRRLLTPPRERLEDRIGEVCAELSVGSA